MTATEAHQSGELFSPAEAQALIDRWESVGGPTTTEVALARTVVDMHKRVADLPRYPWNDLIDMTSGGSEDRVLVVALSAIHDAINANTLALLSDGGTTDG